MPPASITVRGVAGIIRMRIVDRLRAADWYPHRGQHGAVEGFAVGFCRVGPSRAR
jgi:hypothetical protein